MRRGSEKEREKRGIKVIDKGRKRDERELKREG